MSCSSGVAFCPNHQFDTGDLFVGEINSNTSLQCAQQHMTLPNYQKLTFGCAAPGPNIQGSNQIAYGDISTTAQNFDRITGTTMGGTRTSTNEKGGFNLCSGSAPIGADGLPLFANVVQGDKKESFIGNGVYDFTTKLNPVESWSSAGASTNGRLSDQPGVCTEKFCGAVEFFKNNSTTIIIVVVIIVFACVIIGCCCGKFNKCYDYCCEDSELKVLCGK